MTIELCKRLECEEKFRKTAFLLEQPPTTGHTSVESGLFFGHQSKFSSPINIFGSGVWVSLASLPTPTRQSQSSVSRWHSRSRPQTTTTMTSPPSLSRAWPCTDARSRSRSLRFRKDILDSFHSRYTPTVYSPNPTHTHRYTQVHIVSFITISYNFM